MAMELKQAKGNTWYLEEWQLIPLYKTDDHHCIMLDTGFAEQREDIEKALEEAELTPIGILCSHAHNDHSANNRYFQQKYNIPVAMTLAEASICCSEEALKSHFYMNSIGELRANDRIYPMLVICDRILMPDERNIEFCGVPFEIVPTPGHSVAHIAVRTPDDVLYLADALLSGSELTHSRFPYHFCFLDALKTLEALRTLPASLYLLAHKGIYPDLGDLPDRNIALINSRADELCSLLTRPMNLSELSLAACEHFHLRSPLPGAVAMYERNIRSYLDLLKDDHRIDVLTRDGIFLYVSKNSVSTADKEKHICR